jgi:hypothetical protein
VSDSSVDVASQRLIPNLFHSPLNPRQVFDNHWNVLLRDLKNVRCESKPCTLVLTLDVQKLRIIQFWRALLNFQAPGETDREYMYDSAGMVE